MRGSERLRQVIAASVEEIILLPVEECCRNDGDSPSCRFVIGTSG